MSRWLPCAAAWLLGAACVEPPSEARPAGEPLGVVALALELDALSAGVDRVVVTLARDGSPSRVETIEVHGLAVHARMSGVPLGRWLVAVDGQDRDGATIFCGYAAVEVSASRVSDVAVPVSYRERCELRETVCDDEVDDDLDDDVDCDDADCVADPACSVTPGVCTAPSPPPLSATATIGPSGGTLTIPAHGVTVTIGANKLSTPTEVKLVAWGYQQFWEEHPVTPIFELTPGGTEASVSLDLAHWGASVSLSDVRLFHGLASLPSNAMNERPTTLAGATVSGTLAADPSYTAFQARLVSFEDPTNPDPCEADPTPTSWLTQASSLPPRPILRANASSVVAFATQSASGGVTRARLGDDGSLQSLAALDLAGPVTGFDVVGDGASWVVADARTTQLGTDVTVRRVNDAGVTLGGPRVVSDDAFAIASAPRIVRLQSGDLLVAWTRQASTFAPDDVRVRLAWVKADLSQSVARNVDETLSPLGFGTKLGDWHLVSDGTRAAIAFADQATAHTGVTVRYVGLDGGGCATTGIVNLMIGLQGTMDLDAVVVTGAARPKVVVAAAGRGTTQNRVDFRVVDLETGALGPGTGPVLVSGNVELHTRLIPNGGSFTVSVAETHTLQPLLNGSVVNFTASLRQPFYGIGFTPNDPTAFASPIEIAWNASRTRLHLLWSQAAGAQIEARASTMVCAP